jgi:hypothetical protein
LNISRIDGDLANRLGCDSEELFGSLWRPFLHPDDWGVIADMISALANGRADRYVLNAVSRTGEQLHLAVRTLVLHDPAVPTRVGGVIDLMHWQSPRRYFDVG